MNPVLLSTAYLPPVSWLARCVDRPVILEAHEHYVKQSVRNRASICGANGRLDLVVPVDHENLYQQPITAVRIANDHNWKRVHWKSIESAYRNAPYFEYYEDELKTAFHSPEPFLFAWNFSLMQRLFKFLDMEFTPQFTDGYRKELPSGEEDFRSGCPSPENIVPYRQVFMPRLSFIPDLSILDLLFNMGKDSFGYLQLLSRSS